MSDAAGSSAIHQTLPRLAALVNNIATAANNEATLFILPPIYAKY